LEHAKIEEMSWIEGVKNKEILLRVKGERNILHAVSRREPDWIGHNWRRNCLLKHITEVRKEGKMEVTVVQGKRAATG
jgi:hypothetical protein